LKVPKGKGEHVRKKLLEGDLLDVSLKVRREGDLVLFPVTSGTAGDLGCELAEEEFEERELAESDYKDLVDVPSDIRDVLPTSFDVIGEVAIIKLPEELLPYKAQVGLALRRAFPRLTTVALDKGVKGELRVRDLEVIAGGPSTETLHTEYGIRLLVDPARTYFNPRLSNERFRVARLVKPGEVVIDMFAGVGPFAIMMARHAAPKAVYAIDLNPDAVEYMRRNIDMNRAGIVVPILGDARTVLPGLPMSDRIIMNLPHCAIDFLSDAFAKLKGGGTVHLYHICERDEIDRAADHIESIGQSLGIDILVSRLEELKTYSPSMGVFAFDLSLAERV